MSEYPAPIPVNVITGFLGSGKTSLIQRLLNSPELEETAILVNEFGEVGLDHHLFRNLSETTILLGNGCVCCTIRGDLKDALRDLFSQLTRREIPQFKRVIVETSGLADPVPIAYTLQFEPVLRHHFRLGNILTTIDAVNGAGQLRSYGESVKQVAVADRLIITKSDLVEYGELASLKRKLAGINATAPIIDGARETLRLSSLFEDEMGNGGSEPRTARPWFAPDGRGEPAIGGEISDEALAHRHSDGVHSISIRFDTPLDWTAFGIWMTMLLHCHGDRVLRIKGLLNVQGVETPVLINGVQHIVHPPVHLQAWPDSDRSSRLIFIVDAMNRADIETSLAAFNGLANPVSQKV